MIENRFVQEFLEAATEEERSAVEAVYAIGQGPVVFRIPDGLADVERKLRRLVGQLVEVERSYAPIGGIRGYHETLMKLVEEGTADVEGLGTPGTGYHAPHGLDLCEADGEGRRAVMWGVKHLPMMGEIYAVGGAGDRFGLEDEKTGEPLPVACLEFGGHTLLEGMVRDLQAREHLYWKVFGERLVTPIAMMTSEEKDNDRHIREICERAGWFGRPRESFRFFKQGLVPVITKGGTWCMSGPLEMVRKPGGHGVLWRVMEENGVFDWFAEQGRRKALIRQINNPVAGVDNGLLAFTGIGCEEDRTFGFEACHRIVGQAEGTDVLFEVPQNGSWLYGISNIEYVEFEKHGMADEPAEPGSEHSKFPANTNILFADLEGVRERLEEAPLPGLIVNMKKKAPVIDAEGRQGEELAGRLETVMQNIAHHIVVRREERVENFEELDLPTFVVFNERRKTLSGTKKSWSPGGKLSDTPERCYFDFLHNHYELLSRHCGFDVESPTDRETYAAALERGTFLPPFHVSYHPALGPLYSVIGQKVRGGRLAPGAELLLEIAELDVEGLDVEGSLRILATSPLGERAGRCCLRDVRVVNEGIVADPANRYWKDEVKREGSLEIVIEGDGEFVAEGVTFSGGERIVVPAGTRVVARQDGFERRKILSPSWSWDYSAAFDGSIELQL